MDGLSGLSSKEGAAVLGCHPQSLCIHKTLMWYIARLYVRT